MNPRVWNGDDMGMLFLQEVMEEGISPASAQLGALSVVICTSLSSHLIAFMSVTFLLKTA